MAAEENVDKPEPRVRPTEPVSTGQELTFEEAFSSLAKTVEALESGGLTLDAATALYEEGMRLVETCYRLLSQAELKVTQLNHAYSSYLDPGLLGEEE